MGYYLPIQDYQAEAYRRRLEKTKPRPYHVKRAYRIVLNPIKSSESEKQPSPYIKAKRLAKNNTRENVERFSLKKGRVKGKGEQINVQV